VALGWEIDDEARLILSGFEDEAHASVTQTVLDDPLIQ